MFRFNMLQYTMSLFSNILALTVLFLIFLNIRKDRNVERHDIRWLYLISMCAVVEAVAEILLCFVNRTPGYELLNRILSSFTYVATALAAYFWFSLALQKSKHIGFSNIVSKLCAIPAAVVVLLSFASVFFDVLYKISVNNVYKRTSLYILPLIIDMIYLSAGTILFLLQKKTKQRFVFYPIFSFVLPILACGILQTLFVDLSLTSLGITLGTLSLYLSIKSEMAYIDLLSGIYNRQYFEQILNKALNRRSEKNLFCGIILDIDHFKSINDDFGHLVGNDAIKKTAKLLLATVNVSGIDAIPFRYGGDEFVVLLWVKGKDAAYDFTESLKQLTNEFNDSNETPYKLSYSVGYSFFNTAEDTYDVFLKRMDDEMYEQKRKRDSNSNKN